MSTAAPVHGPYRVAPDTWVIGATAPAGATAELPTNVMVIAGAEPVIVDTGTARCREAWLDAVFSLVVPAEVRWLFLSHEAHNHAGNLEALLDHCPGATVVTTGQGIDRLGGTVELPPERVLFVGSGEAFDVGDRVLVAVRPPVFDAPTTRGLFDPTTGVYWSADAFSAPLPNHLTDDDATDGEHWAAALLGFNCRLSPWHTLVDPAAFEAQVDAIAALGVTTVVPAHGPPLRGNRLTQAFRLMRTIPGLRPPAA